MRTNVAVSSLNQYRDMKESGEVGKRQQQVLDVLGRYEWVSCHFISKAISKTHSFTYPSSVSARLNELVTMGKVEQSLDRSPCEVTKNKVHKYRLIKPQKLVA